MPIWLASGDSSSLRLKARDNFSAAKKSAPAIPWLVKLSEYEPPSEVTAVDDSPLFRQLERVEDVLANLGTLHDRTFAERERQILDGLLSKDGFEGAHAALGELLGFEPGKKEANGSPDPWWEAASVCFVFEDNAGAEPTSSLSVNKARQAASHPNWIRVNLPSAAGKDIVPVLITPVLLADVEALPHLGEVCLWPLKDFREWAKEALVVLRKLRMTFAEPGDLFWRDEAAQVFRERGLDARALAERLKKDLAKDRLKTKKKK